MKSCVLPRLFHSQVWNFLCPLLLAALPAGVQAQLVADGATRTLVNETNTFTGTVTVGTNGSFTLLTLSNNVLLTNSVNGNIGLNVTAKSNEVRLISASARWRMGNNLFVGSNGAASRLVVSNGALVENFDGILANGLASSNNVALVTGGGSTWSNRGDLTVGFSGRENQLIVSNGGRVANRFGYLGRQSGSSNNIARVSGSGSVWTNQFDLTVGANDRSNRLIIEAGGVVTCANGVVSSSSSSGNNEVLVTGPGSLWSNRFFLFMGDVAGRNRLVVSNGATVWSGGSILGTLSPALSNQVIVTGPGSVWTNESSLSLGEGSPGNRVDVSAGGQLACADGVLGQTLAANSNAVLLTGSGSGWNNRASLIVGNSGSGNTLTASNGATIAASNLIVGFTTSAAGNRVTVDGGTLRVTNAAGTGVLDLRRGALSLRAGAVDVDRLVMTNVAGGFELAGGTLITRGAAITNIGGFTVGGSTTNPAIWDLRAGTGVHALAVTLSVGSSLSFNQMLITNGGKLTSGDAYIGSNPGSISNVVLLSGAGSKWTAANLDVGNGGAFNRLIVSNGATVEDFNGALGQNSGSSNNLAVVTGAGSLWTNRNEMNVGYQGSGNQLVVSNGGTAFALATRFLGRNSGVVSNTAIVTGAGSRWLGPGNLRVGGPAAFCRLLVSDGARVEDALGFVGSGDFASNNLAVVAGAGSVWSNASSLFVGNACAGNQLVVSNGAAVFGNEGVIGYASSGNNNLVTVTGAGSVWSNAISLFIGDSSTGNQLVVSNGAMVFGYEGLIGYTSSSSNNLATVTGAGSVWSNAVDLFVGNDGRNNQLIVTNGGRVRGQVGTVGLNASSSNNVVVVTGTGSLWTNEQALFVGNSGGGNSLVVSNGGTVSSSDGIIGLNNSSDNNVALVTVTGSSWNIAGDLAIGFSGDANRLVVSNSGRVLNNVGVMLSHSNEVVVTGAGSLWSNRFDVIVGALGRGNRLVVSNGGTVLGGNFVVGQESASTNNRVVVDAGTLLATNAAGTGVLDIRRGTNVLNAGLMDVDQLVITNTLGKFEFNGGTLITRGAVISNGAPFTVGGPGGIPAVWDVRAGAINHVVAITSLRVGGDTSFNRLLVTNGAVLNGSDDFIGFNSTANSNSAIVAGAGSRWAMGDFAVGWSGSLNSLVTSNGGRVVAAGFIQIGANAGSSNNLAVVSGLGSELSTTNDVLNVGFSGAGNQLVVENGGVASSFDGQFGIGAFSSNNQALVTGSGSLWTNRHEMIVGVNGNGNQLVVSNGGTVFTFANKYVGYNDGARSNTTIVTDVGSSWLGDDSLYVGSAGSFNRLIVRNGGRVVSRIGTLGGIFGADNNQVLVTDAGSVWTNGFDVTVGENGSANALIVSNGATLFGASHGFIGRNSGANSNTIVLTDIGSRWLLSSNLYLGSNGAFGRLTITNGARLENEFASIGSGISSSNNEVLITDSGSIWSNQTSFHLGESGRGNRLVVGNGGRVDCENAEVGFNASSSNNVAIVTGAGSFCHVQDSFTLGSVGSGNRLVVSNGAWLHDDNGEIGSFGTDNEAVVTGPGTTWTNRSGLIVGDSRGNNRLVITNGAFVFSRDVWVGYVALSTNNRVVMDGGTLLVTNSTGVGALDVQRGTNVLNAGLIDVARLLVTNVLGQFEFNGGTLVSSGTAVGNGRVFTVGNSASTATFILRNGTHSFANNLVVASNASVIGNGTITGILTVQSGGKLSPGTSIGNLILSSSPVLQGATIMEISKSGAVLTNDQIQVAGPLTLAGSLVVTNIGPTPLTIGDRFQLFNAISFAGSFSNIALPPLPYALAWTNKLALDGSLEVVAYVPPPVTLTIQRSNNFVVLSWPTNAADYCLETSTDLSPPVYWQPITSSVATNGANFVLNLSNNPAVAKQFFRLAFPCDTASVTLAVERSNNVVTVNWPSHAFRLETTFNLAPPVTWQTETNGITSTGAGRTFTFTNSPAVTNQFYRLAFP